MLSNAYFLAKFRFDTAENEPAKNLQNFRKMHFLKMHFRQMQHCSASRRLSPGGRPIQKRQVGAFLPGVSLAVLLTVYAFDSGQSPPVIWEAFLLGILVGTAFSVTVAFCVAGRFGYRRMTKRREDIKFERLRTKAREDKARRDAEAAERALWDSSPRPPGEEDEGPDLGVK